VLEHTLSKTFDTVVPWPIVPRTSVIMKEPCDNGVVLVLPDYHLCNNRLTRASQWRFILVLNKGSIVSQDNRDDVLFFNGYLLTFEDCDKSDDIIRISTFSHTSCLTSYFGTCVDKALSCLVTFRQSIKFQTTCT